MKDNTKEAGPSLRDKSYMPYLYIEPDDVLGIPGRDLKPEGFYVFCTDSTFSTFAADKYIFLDLELNIISIQNTSTMTRHPRSYHYFLNYGMLNKIGYSRRLLSPSRIFGTGQKFKSVTEMLLDKGLMEMGMQILIQAYIKQYEEQD